MRRLRPRSGAIISPSATELTPACDTVRVGNGRVPVDVADGASRLQNGAVMALIKWTPEMSVGVAEFDRQHQGLVDLVNRLHEHMLAGRGREVLAEVLADLVRYTDVHFAGEERLFILHGYPHMRTHRDEHVALTQKVRALQADVVAGKSFVSLPTLNFLREWLTHHIMQSDMDYKSFFAARGVR
jgi:hemerythrin